jgi:hypothetical protein
MTDPDERPSRGWMSTANIWGERKSRLFEYKQEDAPVSGQCLPTPRSMHVTFDYHCTASCNACFCSESAQDSAAAGNKGFEVDRDDVSAKNIRSEDWKPIASQSTIHVVLEGAAEGKMLSKDFKKSTSVFNLEFEDPCGHARLMNNLGILIWEGELEDGEPSTNGANTSHRAVDIYAGDVSAK